MTSFTMEGTPGSILPREPGLADTGPAIAQADLVNGGQGELASADGLESRPYKTLAVRLDNGMHTRLSFVAQLRDSALTEEMLEAVRDHVEAAQSDPEPIAKAAEVRAQIEAAAKARQAEIAGMFGIAAVASEVEAPSRSTGSG
jgi:hypothetical protein